LISKRAEGYYEHKMNYPLDMIFINMSREVVAVGTLMPGNFETSVGEFDLYRG
jgi:uncharacterized membrane protein (UPF0127 family)